MRPRGEVIAIPSVADTELLRSCLLELEKHSNTPIYDIEWLRARCDDTIVGYAGHHLQEASLRQLMQDVASFDEEFPGLLPSNILELFR